MSIGENRPAASTVGDPDDVAALYRQYYPLVFRYGMAMTRCATAAEDISQEVFAALLRDFWRFDPARAAFRSYLYGMVRNIWRDRCRRERRFTSISDDSVTDAVSAGDPRSAFEAADLLARVREEIAQLPPRYREALELCTEHELSSVEAAAVLGVTPEAIRGRVREARTRLRRRLNKILRPPRSSGANHTHGSSAPVPSSRRPPGSS